MELHNGAAMVIARRVHQYKEKVPKILKDKLIGFQNAFNKKKEWARWSIVNHILKKKGGEKPDFWLRNRKKILGKTGF